MGELWRDVWFGARSLLKRPGITAIAVLTLALGIGANTAIFSVVDAVLIRPLPYAQPDRLVFLQEDSPQVPGMSISMADFNDWRDSNSVFESLAPYQADSVVLTGRGDAERLRIRNITAGLFPTLGVAPVIGRPLMPEDDKVGAAPVALISDSLWARKFGSDPKVVGEKLTLDGEIYTIVGVLPSSRFHTSWKSYSVFASLWRHEDTLGGEKNRGSHPGIYAIGRLKPGVTANQAQAQMHDIAARLAQQHPDSNKNISATLTPLLDGIVGDERPGLLIVMAAVGFVLVIACANVANLLLARATERQKEMAIRTALGATRGRLIRQLLTESMLLGIGAGALGLLAAYASTRMLASVASANLQRVEDTSVNTSVLLFALGVSLVTAFLFGIIPALQSSRGDVQGALKEGGARAGAGTAKRRVRSTLVVAEVALSVLLLVGAGLTLKSLYRVLKADPGFDPAHAVAMEFSLPDATYKDDAAKRRFVDQLVAKAAAIPGVESAGYKWPLMGGWQQSYGVEGQVVKDPSSLPSVDMARMTADSFQAMGIRLIKGRFFTSFDNEKGAHVCIVDSTLAASAWPNQDPIGKRVAFEGTLDKPMYRTVVGVVSHTKNYGVDQPSRVEMYVPYDQLPGGGGNIVVRFTGDAPALTAAIRDAARSLDPNVPIGAMQSLDSVVGESTAPRKLSVLLLSFFAALALALAAVGVYGVMSFIVTQRNREMGIRVALGAGRMDLFRLILGNGMKLFGLGIAIGIAAALYLTRLLQALLFQVKPTDIATFSAIPLVLAAVAFVACYLPARRAMRVDPIVALRNE